jgi:pectinesterase inhibitor-like protein
MKLPFVAWFCAMATVLALATMVPVAAARKGGGNMSAVSRICRSTPYPSACETALTSAEARRARDPFAASVQFAMARATTARSLARNLSASAPAALPTAMHDCAELLDISLAQLRDALAGRASDAAGATTWLSAALTNQGTCNDSLAAAAATAATARAGCGAVRKQVAALAQFISTALALHVKRVEGGRGVPRSAAPSPKGTTTFPSWLSEHDRRLLESPATDTITADAVVALDGSGTHRSINEAIAAVTSPVHTEASGRRREAGRARPRRKVIKVKAGRYKESVSISYQQENVMLVGAGKGKTIIDGNKSVAGGYTTYSSATFGT